MSERRLATILAIDVVGYSRLMQADATGVLSALNSIFRSVVKPCVEQAHGRIVKLMGDGALIEFPSARDGLECSVAVQKAMRATPAPYQYGEPLFLRMGLHVGDVLVEGQDIFGDAANVSARLEAEAEAGGILLSRTVADLAGGNLPVLLRSEGRRTLKNIASPIDTLSVDLSDQRIVASRTKRAQTLEIRYCEAKDGQRLAWTSVGEGAPIVKAPNWIGHLELDWRHPGLAPLFDSLSSRRRFVYSDARGNGLSDWEMKNISLDHFVDDLERIFDVAEVERAPIIAISQGSAIAAVFAARCPDRVSSIVIIGGFAIGRAKRDSKKDRDRAEAMRAMMQAGWDDDYPSLRDLITETIIPGASREDRRRYAEDMRNMISPENLGRYREVVDYLNVTELLPNVRCPCLVMHGKGDRMQQIEQGRKMAAGIPKAKFISLDSDNHILTENDPAWPVAEREIYAFLEATA